METAIDWSTINQVSWEFNLLHYKQAMVVVFAMSVFTLRTMFRPVVNEIDKTIFHLLIWSRRDHPAFPLIKSGWLVNGCSVALLNILHELFPAPYLIHWSRDSTFPLRTSQLPVNSRLYCRNWKCTKVIIRLMMQKLTYQPADG